MRRFATRVTQGKTVQDPIRKLLQEDSAPASPNRWSEYEIEAKTSLTDRALRNLKHGDAFAVLDSHGDFGSARDTAEGLYYRDTRFLSHLELRLEGKRPTVAELRCS